VNGRLFDAATLAQLGNHRRPAPAPTWQGAGITETETAGHDRH
jgi:hypothetical protein